MTPPIVVDRLSKRYRSVSACDRISFTVESGQCVGLIGPNGAGKTSLLSCLAGLRLPTTGVVRIDGHDPTRLPHAGSALGYAFDPPPLTTDLTAEGCIVWEALAQGLSISQAQSVIARYDLSDYARRRVGRMSTGQRQRVAIAASLVGDPDVVILDEPTNGLDIEASRWLRDLIVDRTARGKTTVVSSHQLGEVRRIVDRMIVIDRSLRYDGAVPAGSDEELESWYLAQIGREAEVAR
ncbi:hypothetical protein LK09_15320 [Microbacterium mangrovi]|uniref:ABC transporter domain-containing protein n=1 Tax=Microbacterium mangrovi TaxID=1348253 RepID=A0A0B2A043_9MICO|nr:ATP-binding cassette domain-containing protein [Microbacterium mangrovi]KHK96356.1 hypothetical protein LK09_15320 [Microbacterium mangrovi]